MRLTDFGRAPRGALKGQPDESDVESKTLSFHMESGDRLLRVGGLVRVLQVPPQWYQGIVPGEYDETTTIFERCVGRVYPVLGMDECDVVVIGGFEDGTPCSNWCQHTFYLEKDWLEVVAENGLLVL